MRKHDTFKLLYNSHQTKFRAAKVCLAKKIISSIHIVCNQLESGRGFFLLLDLRIVIFVFYCVSMFIMYSTAELKFFVYRNGKIDGLPPDLV